MTREELKTHILETYGVKEDYPWENDNVSAVFRHPENKKWFALIMNIPAAKLGIKSTENIDVVNVKCDNILIGSLIKENGFFPAYHMNKSCWITVALNGTADDEKIKWVLDMSFDATKKKIKAK
ncbi:MAG: MmcQ/YjbR family DNA-binding protein [Oscillospiraceae bacterium]|nr:MmcQ/YjbR family DNA-binding protein [Oscillospiraceae bacterium]